MHLLMAKYLGDSFRQQLKASSGSRRHPDSSRTALFITIDMWFEVRQQVDLVIDLELVDLPRADLAQHLVNLADMFAALFIGSVDDLQQQRGLSRLLQSRSKSGYKIVGEVADKSDSIRQHSIGAPR